MRGDGRMEKALDFGSSEKSQRLPHSGASPLPYSLLSPRPRGRDWVYLARPLRGGPEPLAHSLGVPSIRPDAGR